MEAGSNHRDAILKKLRIALLQKGHNQFKDVEYDKSLIHVPEYIDTSFAALYTKKGGGFVYNAHHHFFIENLLALWEQEKWNSIACTDDALSYELHSLGLKISADSEIALTSCEAMIANSGLLGFSSKQKPKLFTKAKTHLIYATVQQIVPDWRSAYQSIANRYGKNLPGQLLFIEPDKRANITSLNDIAGLNYRQILFLVDQVIQ
jgi:L-lactate utilization protein LutC